MNLLQQERVASFVKLFGKYFTYIRGVNPVAGILRLQPLDPRSRLAPLKAGAIQLKE